MKHTLTVNNVFSNISCELGEGPLWHGSRQSLFWFDIKKCMLFEKGHASNTKAYDSCWQLNEIGSALALNAKDENSLFIVTDKSFGIFSLITGEYTAELDLELGEGMRANDGGVGPDGRFWFGSMEKSPSGQNGSIYHVSSQMKLSKVGGNIGIPNTFCWRKKTSTLFLSDSYIEKTFSYSFAGNGSLALSNKTTFIDLNSTGSTPDGGAMDEDGGLWIAHWGGSCVNCYSPEGKVINSIDLPAPQVTSCCFGGRNKEYLFITTATENMSAVELKRYPLSGCTFFIKLTVKGDECHSFEMDVNKYVG